MNKLAEYTPAESNVLLLKQLVRDAKLDFLKIGAALCVNQENAYWSTAGQWESFKDFVESLGVGDYTWITRLMGISRLIEKKLLTAEQILEIGVSKAALLLPSARKGELTEEMIEVAKGIPYSELRAELKGEAESTEQEDEVCCPQCGTQLHGLRWIKYAHKQKAETASPE